MAAQFDREQYLRWIKDFWPDKGKVLDFLADSADTISRKYPPAPRQAVFGFIARLGLKVGDAKTPEECLDAFARVLDYLESPEPGWGTAPYVPPQPQSQPPQSPLKKFSHWGWLMCGIGRHDFVIAEEFPSDVTKILGLECDRCGLPRCTINTRVPRYPSERYEKSVKKAERWFKNKGSTEEFSVHFRA